MQNALVVGPIAVFLPDTGPAPVVQAGHGFSQSFAADIPVPAQSIPAPDGTDVALAGLASLDGSLLPMLAPGAAVSQKDPVSGTAFADRSAALPVGRGGLWKAVLPAADDAGNPRQQAVLTGQEVREDANPETGMDRLGDALPLPPSSAARPLDPPIPAGEGSNTVPLPAKSSSAETVSPKRGAEPVIAVDGAAAKALPVAEGGRIESKAASAALTETGSGQPAPVPPVSRPTGNSFEAGAATPAETAPMIGIGVNKIQTQSPPQGTLVMPPEGADGLPANLAKGPGSGQTAADRASQSLRAGQDQPLTAGQAPKTDAPPDAAAAPESRASVSIWESVILDTAPNSVGRLVFPLLAVPAADPVSAGPALQTGAVDQMPVAASASVAPTQVPLVPAAKDVSPVAARSPIRPDATSPTLPLPAVPVASPIAGLLLEPWPDTISGRERQGESALALGAIGSSFGLTGQPGSTTTSAPLSVPQVAVQLAAVLRHGPGAVTELALAPVELGKVRLRMEPDAKDPDRLVVLITVERPETLELFRRHAGELAEAIRNAGFAGSSIDFGRGGEGRPTESGQDGRGDSDLQLSDDQPEIHAPMRHVIGETLDLRL